MTAPTPALPEPAAPPPGPARGAAADLASLAALWAVACLAVDPRGDFPLIDDWAYALPVRHLVEEGALRFTGWQSMTLITQVLWGSLFVLPGGFSFTALRLSTLVAGLAAVGAQYALVREAGGGRAAARWAALALLACPVFLLLSHTFMTDVPFLALTLASAAFLLRGLHGGRPVPLFAGFFLAAAAVLLRQVGLALPLAFCGAAALRWGVGRRLWVGGVLPLFAIAALLFGWERAVAAAGLEPALYPVRSQALAAALSDLLHLRLGVLRNPVERGLQLWPYAGLFALPFSAWVGARIWVGVAPARRRGGLLWAAGLCALASVGLGVAGRALPRFGNVLLDFGLGPRTLPGGPPGGAPAALWAALTALALLSGAVLVGLALRAVARAWRDGAPTAPAGAGPAPALAAPAFLAGVGAIYLAPLLLAYGPAFDRYFLLPTALAVALAAAGAADLPAAPRAGRAVAGAALAGVLAFAVAGTHDYLAWNRARHALAAWLEQEHGAPFEEIDAGFELASWRHTSEALRRGESGGRVDRPDARYAVAFVARPGDRILRERRLAPWLPWSPKGLRAVERGGAVP